jgi:hypothetical protein
MKRLIILIVLLVSMLPSTAFAWGPITHENIGQRVKAQVPVANITAYNAGCVMPDWGMTVLGSNQDNRQRLFHSLEYLTALKKYTTTTELKSFVQGWQVHLTSDKIENQYSAYKGFATEYAVDNILPKCGFKITLSAACFNLINKACSDATLKVAFPTAPQLAMSSVLKNTIVSTFNLYLSKVIYQPSTGNAYDYASWVEKSINESILILK